MKDGADIKGHEELAFDASSVNTNRILCYFQLAMESLVSPSCINVLLKTREKGAIYFAQAVTFLCLAVCTNACAIVPLQYVVLHGLSIAVFYWVSSLYQSTWHVQIALLPLLPHCPLSLALDA